MDVGSSINIYGHLFGWHVYDMLYTFVIATGIWTIPFFIIFYSVFVYKGYGESDGYNAKNALIAMEKYVYTTLIVIAIFFTPSININKLKMTYNDGSKIQTAGNTSTRFDGLKDSVPNSVKIPGGWYIILFSSSAFNGVIKSILPNQFQARDLMYDMQQVSLDDPQLQSELNDFERKCRQPAQARLNAIRTNYPSSKIAIKLNQLTVDTQKEVEGVWSKIEDFMGGGTNHWKIIERYPGNLYFMDTLYDDSLLCKTGQNPKTTACIPKTSNPLNPPAGKDCKSWWDGAGFGLGTGIVDKLEDAFGKIPFGGIDEDMFVAAKLMTLGGNSNLGEKSVGNKEGNLWQWGEEKSAGLMTNIANVVNSATNSVVRFALPVVQGIAMMLIFMLLIIFILFSRYNIAQMAGLAILLFGISFLTSIWSIIGWIDNVMLLVIHGGAVGLVERVIDTIGPKTAEKLLTAFGEDMLSNMLADNIYEFVNLMDNDGSLVFSDRQASRMEGTLSHVEFGFGQGGYQPTEFIKRYLPDGFFDLLIVDEGHEYKNEGSAQGQAMGVLANKAKKVLLLTGTLMGGYASDLFYLLWRIMPSRMIEDGFQYSDNGSLGSASMAFMREHGILQDVFVEKSGDNHRTAKGKNITQRTKKRPGFGPKGICRYVLPYTVFLKLKDVGDVLPAYNEHYIEIDMEAEQADKYYQLETVLKNELNDALRKGDTSLMGVVMNALLRWPDSCFREEVVRHPHSKQQLAYADVIFAEDEHSPKEKELIKLCRREKSKNRRVLVYTTYTGKHDTTSRLKCLLTDAGLKTSVLRSSVATDRREEWILDQVDLGIDVLVCNPELVKTGLDLLEFPTLAFLQSGYNVYTIQQASRRSWRIGQKLDVDVYFFGYAKTAQSTCLSLMAEKITVSQSTSGDMPDTGLDVLNQSGDSIEVALAKQLMT